jgi:hypothetical protein
MMVTRGNWPSSLTDVPIDSCPPATLGADVTVAGILPLNETVVTG